MESDSAGSSEGAPDSAPVFRNGIMLIPVTLNGVMLIPRLCYLVGEALPAADLHCLESTSWWHSAGLRWQLCGLQSRRLGPHQNLVLR